MDQIKEEVLLLPEQIREKQRELLSKTDSKKMYDETVDSIKKYIEFDVVKLSKQEEFKKELSNATLRNAKVEELLKNNEDYKNSLKSSKDLAKEISHLELEVSYLRNKLRAYETFSRL